MTLKSGKRILYILPAVLWAALIFVVSSIPSHSLPSTVIQVKDLVLHFIEYAVFGLFLGLAFVGSSDCATPRNIGLAFLVGSLYGASDEIHQMFVAGRVASVADFLADAAGALFGLALFVLLPRLYGLLRPRQA